MPETKSCGKLKLEKTLSSAVSAGLVVFGGGVEPQVVGPFVQHQSNVWARLTEWIDFIISQAFVFKGASLSARN